MELFEPIATFAFYGLMALVLSAAVATVVSRNLFRVAIFLAFTLLGVAMVYFFLHAEFIAAIQILLYVGAIMTLVIFAIMLTAKMNDPSVPQSNRQAPVALTALGVVAVILITAIVRAPWKLATEPNSTSAVELGKSLMGEFVLPFEVISLVLLVALIGAIVTARSDQ